MQHDVEPMEELMPHRSSYCGGGYRNPHSCLAHGCMRSLKENLIGFTEGEHMKVNLANLCCGDDICRREDSVWLSLISSSKNVSLAKMEVVDFKYKRFKVVFR